jgi:hypothetical protein
MGVIAGGAPVRAFFVDVDRRRAVPRITIGPVLALLDSGLAPRGGVPPQ